MIRIVKGSRTRKSVKNEPVKADCFYLKNDGIITTETSFSGTGGTDVGFVFLFIFCKISALYYYLCQSGLAFDFFHGSCAGQQSE